MISTFRSRPTITAHPPLKGSENQKQTKQKLSSPAYAGEQKQK